MIKIIKEGQHTFRMKCIYCETIFSYQLEDIQRKITPYVNCPLCSNMVFHANREKTPLVQEDNNNEKKEI